MKIGVKLYNTQFQVWIIQFININMIIKDINMVFWVYIFPNVRVAFGRCISIILDMEIETWHDFWNEIWPLIICVMRVHFENMVSQVDGSEDWCYILSHDDKSTNMKILRGEVQSSLCILPPSRWFIYKWFGHGDQEKV